MAMQVMGVPFVDPFADIARKKMLEDALNEKIGDILVDKINSSSFTGSLGAMAPDNPITVDVFNPLSILGIGEPFKKISNHITY
jgi:hypothetical protein